MRMTIVGVVCLMVGGIVFAAAANADETNHVFVRGGQAKGCIVVSKDAPPLARFAAEELQTYVAKATGARLKIVAELPDGDAPALVVGEGTASRKLGISATELAWDAFHFQSVGQCLVIAGRDDPKADPRKDIPRLPGLHKYECQRGTVFGVYEFLERYLGIRWYVPVDEIGEVVPKTADLIVPRLKETVTPDCWMRLTVPFGHAADLPEQQRDASYGYTWVPRFKDKGEADAFRWRRFLYGMRLKASTSSFGIAWTIPHLIAPGRFEKSHPEFFALKQNKKDRWIAPPRRGIEVDTHNCLSRKELQDELIADISACFQGKPPADRGVLNSWGQPARDWSDYVVDTPFGKTFILMTSDHPQQCFCEACQTALKTEGSYAQVVWKGVIRVINEVTKECPDAQFGIVAMGLLQVPPRNLAIPKNVCVFVLTQGPDPEFVPARYAPDDNVAAVWKKLVPPERLGFKNIAQFHEGFTNTYPIHPGMVSSAPRAYAAYFKRRGPTPGHMWHAHVHNIAHDHLNLYVSHKVLWDLKTDVDALLEEYYAKFYGPAREPMKKFWEDLESQYRKLCGGGKRPNDVEIWTGLYDAKAMARWKGCFDEAQKLVAQADSIYARRLAYMKAMVLAPLIAGQEEFANFLKVSDATRITASRVAGAPPMPDGNGDDPAWKKAKSYSLQLADAEGKLPVHSTSLRALWDDEHLYLLVECAEEDITKMRALETIPHGRWLWLDDGLELFFDVNRDRTTYYQFLVNHKGVPGEGHAGKTGLDLNWRSQARFRVIPLSGNKGYTLEAAFPLSAFKLSPKTGQVIGFNLLRKRVRQGDQTLSGKDELQTWSPLIGRQSGGFGKPHRFASLELAR